MGALSRLGHGSAHQAHLALVADLVSTRCRFGQLESEQICAAILCIVGTERGRCPQEILAARGGLHRSALGVEHTFEKLLGALGHWLSGGCCRGFLAMAGRYRSWWSRSWVSHFCLWLRDSALPQAQYFFAQLFQIFLQSLLLFTLLSADSE